MNLIRAPTMINGGFEMKKRSWPLLVLGLLIIVIVISAIIPKETHPSDDTRVILDHTYHSYIAPVCFEDSDPTNFLEEATLEKARELNYEPHTECTEQALKSEKDKLLTSILKDIGIMKKKWDNW